MSIIFYQFLYKNAILNKKISLINIYFYISKSLILVYLLNLSTINKLLVVKQTNKPYNNAKALESENFFILKWSSSLRCFIT